MLQPWDPLGRCREGMGNGTGGSMGQGRNNTKFGVRMTQVQVPIDALVAGSSLARSVQMTIEMPASRSCLIVKCQRLTPMI